MRRSPAAALVFSEAFVLVLIAWSAGAPPNPVSTELPMLKRYPWDTNESFAIRLTLEQRLDVNLQDQKLEDVLSMLSKRSGLRIVPNWAALSASAIERDTEVTLQVSGQSVEKILRLIVEDVGGGETELAYYIDDSVVRVSTKEDLSRGRIIVTYDCEDLLNVDEDRLAKHIGRVLEAAARYGGLSSSTLNAELSRLIREVHQDSRQQLRNELVTAIQQAIDPESWREAGGNVGSIVFVGDKMIVTQTRTTHAQVFELLERLRSNTPAGKPIAVWP